MKPPKKFYARDTVQVAQDLLGLHLAHKTPEGTTVGKIVETEAYLHDDPASHSFRGKSERNEAMFGPPGTGYVYLIYGVHHCFNIVTHTNGVGEAVLIRALEPVEGIELMQQRRNTEDIKNLCSGPAKLVQAMGISKQHNGLKLGTQGFSLVKPKKFTKPTIHQTTRIGITKAADKPYRFYIKESPYVSRK